MSAINPENIFRSAHFIDNSHYDAILSIFKQNIHKDLQNVTRLLSRCATEDEKLDVLGKYFSWRDVPNEYFERIKKSSQFSNSFRTLGNESYKGKKISEALRFYNLAILFAHAKSPEKGLALANRSALLMGLKEYEDALTDCIKALDYAEVLGDSEIVDKLKIRKAKLETLSENGTNLHGKHFPGTELLREIVEKVGKNNDEIEGAAEFVRIFTQEGKGRGLRNVGQEKVKAGNCILIDAGYTIMLDKQTNWDTQHCSGCGKVILGGVSDEEDVFSTYCSSTCMENFTKTYGNLPTLYPYFHHIEPLHECLLICKIFAKSRDHDLGQSVTKSKYDARSYSTVANLMAHSIAFDPTRITAESPHFKAIFIGHLLKNLHFLNLSQPTISRLTLRHLFSLPHNMITLSDWASPEGPITHPLWDSRAREKYLTIKTKSYATGVFPVTALCNHSCDPNCVWVQNPRVGLGVLVTIREIGAGEELCISYKQPWSRMRGDERRKWLREGYGFECGCVACIEDWKMLKGGDENVDKIREFETLLKNGERLLNSGNVRQAWRCFMEIEGMIRGEDRRLEWVQRGEEFGRRAFVEMGMR